MTLTVKQIEAAKFGLSKERLGDGTGLYLRLYSSGAKRFQMQVPNETDSSRRVWVTLGDFPKVSLKEARDTASWIRVQVGRGWTASQIRGSLNAAGPFDLSEPAAEPSKAETPFKIVAADWFDRKRAGLKNGKHIAQNWNTVETYAFPHLGNRPIGQITLQEVVDTMRPIWRDKHETARRTLGRIHEIFELAKLEYGLTVNPAQFDPQIAYGRVRRQTKHFGSLPWERMPELWEWLVDVPCDEITRQFTMLILLSAKRTGEVRFSRFDYFYTSLGQIWVTPAEQMKMGQEHRVPLSDQMLMILDNARVLSGETGFLFAKKTKSGVVSENNALNLLKRFDPAITGHGARASFKGWARSQRRYERDAIEFALAHGLPPLDAAYFREDLLEERRVLMQDWADFVTGESGVPTLRDAVI